MERHRTAETETPRLSVRVIVEAKGEVCYSKFGEETNYSSHPEVEIIHWTTKVWVRVFVSRKQDLK